MMPVRSDLLSPPNLLIVDSHALSRLVIAEYLRECGFRVHEAVDSDEAMKILAAPDVTIDLVLSDVQMPDGSPDSFGLARWIREHHPEVKVVLSSEVSRSAEIAGVLCESRPRLKKPYDPQHTVSRIKQLLAHGAARH
jgi:DNA-binding response OmpR family regulator